MTMKTTCFITFFCIFLLQITLTAHAQYLELAKGPQDLCGYKNSQTGELVIPYRYHFGLLFSQGIAAVRLFELWGFIKENGEQLVPYQYKSAGSFSCNRAMVQVGDLRGYVNRSGDMVIPPTFVSASPFRSGLACVQKKDLSWGYIDTLGRVVIKFLFDRAYPFSDGLACVRKKGRFGYIDTTGKLVIPYKYSFAQSFQMGLACTGNGGKYTLIDVEGNSVIPIEASEKGIPNMDVINKYRRGEASISIQNKQGERIVVREKMTVRRDTVIMKEVEMSIVEVKPLLLGRDAQFFMQWVSSQIDLPASVIKEGILGRVELSFVVDYDGFVTEVVVTKSVRSSLDEEAVRAVYSSPQWTPGYQNGKPVKVRYNFPITFSLR
jgi:TonB family protein